jgi:hypothetical protein
LLTAKGCHPSLDLDIKATCYSWNILPESNAHQGNYDEFRFFTGMRPSEQIALLVADFDAAKGTLTVNRARVAGFDKESTKAGEDRLIELCPRALAVLTRQLALRARLELASKINHDLLFFKQVGEPIRNLQYPYVRWRRTLTQMRNIRYRKPYCVRHSSVSWDLMVGKHPLWVAKQHGHSITTMLRVYAAWTEGATETDIRAIKRAVVSTPRGSEQAATAQGMAMGPPPEDSRSPAPVLSQTSRQHQAPIPSSLASGHTTLHRQRRAKSSKGQ